MEAGRHAAQPRPGEDQAGVIRRVTEELSEGRMNEKNGIRGVELSTEFVRLLTESCQQITIKKDVCDLCGFYKPLFEFDNSGEEYSSNLFCIECLNNIWEEYYKIFEDGDQ